MTATELVVDEHTPETQHPSAIERTGTVTTMRSPFLKESQRSERAMPHPAHPVLPRY